VTKKPPPARNANTEHMMPARRVHACGTIRIPMVRVSVIMRDCDEERAWCEHLRDELRRDGVMSDVYAVAGMVSVYREDCEPVRRHYRRREIPKTLQIRAKTRRWVGGERNRRLAYVSMTAYPLAREYRCAFCRRVFLLDEHGEEYVRSDEHDDEMGAIYIHTGVNRHSRCCAQCLPLLRAQLPFAPVAHLRAAASVLGALDHESEVLPVEIIREP